MKTKQIKFQVRIIRFLSSLILLALSYPSRACDCRYPQCTDASGSGLSARPVHSSQDVDFSQLERTDHATYCPFKGDCSYYSIPAGGKKSVNAVWSYRDPFPAVEQIKGHVAFYPDSVDEIAEQLPM